jgi:acyl-CoA thioesterase-1
MMIACSSNQAPATSSSNPPPTSEATVDEPEPKIVVILGDSLTAGFGVSQDQAFPALIQDEIDKLGWNFEVVDAGVSGDTTASGLRRLDWLLRRKIDVLVIELGANDGLRGVPADETRRNIQAMIDKTKRKYPDVKIVIAGMKLPPNMGLEYTAGFEDIFSDLARSNNAALIPFLLDGVAADPKLNLIDRIHPTAEGHKILAQNVWIVLKPVLESIK